ncbi:MAG TPA: hypothetical protein VK567_02115, partial [Bradyrhizobium sp.]|nr:hypothetical protein [Bradyrhizobium sp.]
MHVRDPSQDRLLAARQRGLFSKSIWNFGNSPCKFFLDHPCLGNVDPRRQARSGGRLLKQDLGHLCLTVAQENNEIVMVAGKGIGAVGRDREFRPSGLLHNHPIAEIRGRGPR